MKGKMLAKALRLTSARDFEQVYRRGKRFSTKNILAVRAKFPDLASQNLSRFGFVVSKKHVAKIVKRNRIKRRLRALVLFHLGQIPQGYKYVISAKTGIDVLSGGELAKEFEEMLKKMTDSTHK